MQQILEESWERAEQTRTPWRADQVPVEPERFIAWLQELVAGHAVCGHPLFDFLGERAGREQVLRYMELDGPLNVRFYEVLLMAMVGARGPMRQELLRNLVDETGDGDERRGHANLCRAGLEAFGLSYDPASTAELHGWQGLAGYNHVVGVTLRRRHHYRMIGTLAVTEVMDPPNYTKLLAGCTRLGLATPADSSPDTARQHWGRPAGLLRCPHRPGIRARQRLDGQRRPPPADRTSHGRARDRARSDRSAQHRRRLLRPPPRRIHRPDLNGDTRPASGQRALFGPPACTTAGWLPAVLPPHPRKTAGVPVASPP
ncbi:hypothetical protein GCM10017687_04820 [Streptomyces echinatus]|uniref:iron-containing redox enzyme family protein n=1 Tax=Streptomyces echinatus TaxID=67293 RepID=UPI0031EA833D